MKIVAFPFVSYFQSPLGYLQIKASNQGIHYIDFIDDDIITIEQKATEQTLACESWLAAYFNGKPTAINFKLAADGTPFQKNVWDALLDIPFGQTITYQEMAMKIGDSNQTRAIANAIGNNPLALVIPCHRVIGSNKNLTGYAWGLKRKNWLIDFEGKTTGRLLSLF